MNNLYKLDSSFSCYAHIPCTFHHINLTANMDRIGDTVKAVYHTEPYQAAAAALSSFQPLSNVRQHLCGIRKFLLSLFCLVWCADDFLGLQTPMRKSCACPACQYVRPRRTNSRILLSHCRHDPSRSVIAHHYCTHLKGKNMHQCLIFDSDSPGARLIGIEYVVPEETFQALDDDEKRYWHSHKFG